MAILITLQGPDAGRKFPLDGPSTLVGRQFDSSICLAGAAVSRHHAQIHQRDNDFYVEDLGSSNGTYLNGKRLPPNIPAVLTERDNLQIGPYVFALRPSPTVASTESNLVVKHQVSATTLSESVYGHDPGTKLQVVLEIAQHLARTLELEPLLDTLLEDLIRLFPQADRAMVLLCEEEKLVVRGQRCRQAEDATSHPYSRTVVRRALDEGVGILSEDARADQRFETSVTLTSLDLHSLLCVPLIGQDGRRLGVMQVDRFRKGAPFRGEDLQLLTAVCIQVAVVLDMAALHADSLRQQRLQQELAFAREIQQGFLPEELGGFPGANFEIYGRVFPAQQVAGDLYDFLPVAGGRLGFYIGDVSGKGVPAALFMVAVRTLCRHLAKAGDRPAATLRRLNDALAADNPHGMFVTLIHGLYTPATGELVLSSGGHPPPLLRHADGKVAEVPLVNGRLLGFDDDDPNLHDMSLTLTPGQTLVFYTDGVSEARDPARKSMFGDERLAQVVAGFEPSRALSECAEELRAAVEDFTRSKELHDDVTVLILRRRPQ